MCQATELCDRVTALPLHSRWHRGTSIHAGDHTSDIRYKYDHVPVEHNYSASIQPILDSSLLCWVNLNDIPIYSV